MPFFGELQRDRVALLLTLNVLVFVGYTGAVFMLVAQPSVWLLTFLIAGSAYNVIELWQSPPGTQPPRAVSGHARSALRPGADEIARPRLDGSQRLHSISGMRGTAIGEGSLAQRLSQLHTLLPLEPSAANDSARRSVEQPATGTATEPVGALLAERREVSAPADESVLAEVDKIVGDSGPATTELVSTLMIPTSTVSANSSQQVLVPGAEPVLELSSEDIHVNAAVTEVRSASETLAISAKEVVSGQMPIDAESATLISPRPESQVLARAQAIEPVRETVASSALKQEARPVIHLAGRRDVVDIVIASLADETNRAQPPSKPGSAEPTATGKPPSLTESIAMIRSELARSRGNTRSTSHAKAPVAPPRRPPVAEHKPAKSSADGTRDRVMFVWHGRHFLAPIEGRHPLRVAQSLYDFMVEEETERA